MELVAPFVGAWIEILSRSMIGLISQVAPFVGAWIEMIIYGPGDPENAVVAPFVGAWIEIVYSFYLE